MSMGGLGGPTDDSSMRGGPSGSLQGSAQKQQTTPGGLGMDNFDFDMPGQTAEQ